MFALLSSAVLTCAIAAFLLLAGFAWQKLCKSSKPAWIKQFHLLGRPRKHKFPGTAVICGGRCKAVSFSSQYTPHPSSSIAGIVTARICADHFERVIVVDPEIDDPDKPKTRLVQYNASHAFLTLFIDGARRLWPTFDDELKASGARTAPADMQIHYAGLEIPYPRDEYAAGKVPDTMVIRRATGQALLHRLLMKHPTAANIIPLAGTVRGFNVARDRACIESVLVRQADGKQTSLNDVALVVDCTGGIQGGFKWLKAAGVPLPDSLRSHYDGNLCYLTLCFDVPPALASTLPIPEAMKNTGALHVAFSQTHELPMFLGLIVTDNNTMQLLLGNSVYEDLPRTRFQVIPFLKASNLPLPPWVVEVVDILCERTDPSFDPIRLPAQSYVRYEKAKDLPSNFVAVGDANLKLNPIHGQGFAKCIVNGIALAASLHAIDEDSVPTALPADFSAKYFRKSAGDMEALWDATRLHDYGSPVCEPMEGETKDTGSLARWFERKLLVAASQDNEVASAVWHVRHLLAADKALLAPTVLWKILRAPSKL
ncbi:hypothetical protein C8R47DRAFT_1232136 [Mycena vitilis]|nr:hypothetical protein C8R47DRAFT_1232136 [Mycena vitilis]